MTRATTLALLAALVLVLAPAAARAAISCIITATDINFGTFSGTRLTATGTVTLTCSGDGNNLVHVKLSTGSSNVYIVRTMKNGANSLPYNMYTDSAATQIFGDGTGVSNFATVPIRFIVKSPPGPQVMGTATVFAVLPAQATPPTGAYSDLITVTLDNDIATTTFLVTANVAPSCTVSASNLSFGAYSGVVLDGTTTLSATCASGTPYNIGLGAGTSAGATVTARAMTGPASALLHYGLFRDAARSLNWGATVGTDTVASTGTGAAQTFTVFGRVPAGQFPGAGLYSDTITATLTF